MRGWFTLPIVFSIRRDLPLFAFTLFALSLCPSVARAQEVIVFPKAASVAEPASDSPLTINIFDIPARTSEAADSDSAQLEAPELNLKLATTAAVAPPAAAPQPSSPLIPAGMQCQVDADCIFSGDTCGVYIAINKKYANQASKALPQCADKNGNTSHTGNAVAAMRAEFSPVCKNQVCTLQAVKKASNL